MKKYSLLNCKSLGKTAIFGEKKKNSSRNGLFKVHKPGKVRIYCNLQRKLHNKMNKTVQVCIKCNSSLAIRLKLHFCPYCGTAQLAKKLIEERTTQGYDPYDPAFKPWRDKSLLPKRTYKSKEDEIKNKQPWCPPMRQLNKRKPKVGTIKEVVGETIPVQNPDVPICPGSTNFEEVKAFENVLGIAKAKDAKIKEQTVVKEPFLDCKQSHPVFVYI
jgi:predicted RNA-binding Zn-ribbon protein involved in translation (DUF1610 family)